MQGKTTIQAEVSVREKGSVYVGVKAREMLGVGYNDELSITFPDKGPSESDLTISGCLDTGNSIYVGRELARTLQPDDTIGATAHIEAVIKKGKKTWYDNEDTDDTDRRWQKVKHLAAEIMPN